MIVLRIQRYGLKVFTSLYLVFSIFCASVSVTAGQNQDIRLVKDITEGSGDSLVPNVSNMVSIGQQLYFAADDQVHGSELWITDGSAAGTHMVQDMNPGIGDTFPVFLTAFNGALVFADAYYSPTLWKSDGSPNGVLSIHEFAPTEWRKRLHQPLVVDGAIYLFFSLSTTDEQPRAGFELWTSKGTSASTTLLKGVYSDNGDSDANFGTFIPDLTEVNGTIYFSADDGVHGYELWRTDGTADGTYLVKDLTVGSDSSWPAHLTQLGDMLYFVNSADGSLWQSDGSESGTVLVSESVENQPHSGYIHEMISHADSLYFLRQAACSTGDLDCWSLWKSDGSTQGTVLIKEIAGEPEHLMAVGKQVIFTVFVQNQEFSQYLWVSDGSSSGTHLLKGFVDFLSKGFNAASLHEQLYFAADDGQHGLELWQSDGTVDGTQLVDDLVPGAASSDPRTLTAAFGALYFSASDAEHGRELYRMKLFEPQNNFLPIIRK
ncbi:MAG: hypothetical protein H6641_09845 [Caldilineaceae bacterium]|nr:hypothetical protein [Caldilineaceae bacterium]